MHKQGWNAAIGEHKCRSHIGGALGEQIPGRVDQRGEDDERQRNCLQTLSVRELLSRAPWNRVRHTVWRTLRASSPRRPLYRSRRRFRCRSNYKLSRCAPSRRCRVRVQARTRGAEPMRQPRDDGQDGHIRHHIADRKQTVGDRIDGKQDRQPFGG